jgi:hypothetical protein
MAPDSGVVDISAEEAWDWRGREELYLLAPVIPAREAWLALVADDVGFDGHAISNLEVCYGRMHS